MKNSLLLMGAIAFVSTACGPGQLDDNQKAQFFGTVGDVSRTANASRASGQQMQARGAHGGAMAVFGVSSLTGAKAEGNPYVQRQRDFEGVLQQAQCKVEFDPGTAASTEMSGGFDPGSLTKASMKVEFAGKQCPMTFSMWLQGEGSESGGKVSFGLVYAIQAAQLLKLADVSKMDVQGSIEVNTSETSMEAKGDVKGSIESQEHGNVEFAFKVDAKQSFSQTSFEASGSMELTLKYDGFEGTLKAEANGQEMKYSLNGEEMSPEKLNEYFNDYGTNFEVAENAGPGADSGAPSVTGLMMPMAVFGLH